MIKIQTAGLEDYLDGEGGTTNVKALILGRPGCGKTRGASFWKRPLLLDFEDGRAVLADRGTPYIRIRSVDEAKEALRYIKKEVGKPSRSFDTVIVDTVDGFQLMATRERLAKVGRARLEAFEGDYDAVNNPIKEVIAGLLELPINVVVNVHMKQDGQVKVKDAPKKATAGEDTLLMTQQWTTDLVGGIREQIAGWFDLVGLMENEWGVEDGKQVIKRFIRWQPIPEVPFLKDRLYAFPKKTPVKFEANDYEQLAGYIAKKAKGLKPSAVVETVDEAPEVAPADMPGGPVKAEPSGVLPRPRKAAAPKAAEAPVEAPPAETVATESGHPEPAAPTTEEAIATVEQTLGGEVISEETTPRDYAAEAEKATTRAQVKEVWNAALAAGALTAGLKARLTVLGKNLPE